MALLFRTIGAATALALASPAAAGTVQERIYPAPKAPLSLAGLPPTARMISVETADGLTLAGIAIAPRGDMPTLLVLHGNGSSAADALRWLEPLAARGYGIVAAEYRGYSGNPGKPGEDGLTADGEAFLGYAAARRGAGAVWVLGHSLGAGVAFDLAARHKLDALITVGAFTRLRAAAPKLARAFVPNDYDNLAAVPQLDEPYFLIHGLADDTIASSEGEKLHAAAGAAGKSGGSFAIVGAGHRPDAVQIAAILETIGGWFATGRYSTAALPAEIKTIPFGQERPLNP
jgi:pimeloyl-ACP methyl ester carboxylesterase